jgi:hypothetical protein
MLAVAVMITAILAQESTGTPEVLVKTHFEVVIQPAPF